MFKKTSLWVLAGFGMLAIAGCATGSGRNYDSEINSLNSRMASLQAQLSQAESEKQALANKLDSALSDLEAAKAQPAAGKVSSQESDLK